VLVLIVSMTLVGAVLGTRFKVLILVPAIGLAAIANVAGGIVHGDSASAILTATVIAAVCLQLGYFCGMVAQYASAVARAHSSQPLQTRSAR
jgi:Exopolysaccharide production repressor